MPKSKKSEDMLEVNRRVFPDEDDIDNEELYSIIRGAAESIGIEITDADASKGYVSGHLEGNKKYPFTAKFKKNKKDKTFTVTINHKFPLKNITRRDIRELDPDKYKERLIVDFWDMVYEDLGLGRAPGFGMDKEESLKAVDEKELAPLMQRRLLSMIDSDMPLRKIITGAETDPEKIRKKYKFDLLTLSKRSRWRHEPIAMVELFLDRNKSQSVVVAVSKLDFHIFTATPLEVDLIVRLPRPLPTELNMSYKCNWTAPVVNDVSQKIVTYLNFEVPTVEKEFRKLFDTESTWHFKFKETITEKGKKTKLTYDQILLDTVNIVPVDDPTAEEERFILIFRYLLKIGEDGKSYSGFLKISDIIYALKDLLNVLKRFFVYPRREEATGVSESSEVSGEDEGEEEESGGIRRCSQCGWLLSATAKKCPMCGADVRKIREEKIFGVKTAFNTELALEGFKERHYADRLMKSFDEALKEWGDAESARRDAARDNLIAALEAPSLSERIAEIIEDEDRIKEILGPLFDANKIAYSRERIPIGRYLVMLKGYDIPWVYIVLERLKMLRDEIFPVVVSYIIEAPFIHHKFFYARNERNKKIFYRWDVDEGEDPEIVKVLNKGSKEFTELLEGTYKMYKEGPAKYIEPILDAKGRVKGVELDIELYPLIRVEPFTEGKPRSVVIMRQFLDYKQTGYIPMGRVFALLESIYGIIDLFKEDYFEYMKKKEKEETESKEKEVEVDFNFIDKKIMESKYTYRAHTEQKAAEAAVGSPIETDTEAETEIGTEGSAEVASAEESVPEAAVEADIDALIGGALSSEEEVESISQIDKITLEGYSVDVLEDLLPRTSFRQIIPDFNVDPSISDREIEDAVTSLKMEIRSVIQLIKNEVLSLRNGTSDYNMCRAAVDNLIKQIEIAQAKIRAYEFMRWWANPLRGR